MRIRISPLIPYIAVGIGFIGLHSAWIAILGYHLGMFLVLYHNRHQGITNNFFRGGHILLASIAIFSGMLAGIILYNLALALELQNGLCNSTIELGLNDSTWLGFIIYFATVNPCLEELFWRGYLGSPSRRLHPNDFWFAGYHLLVLGYYLDWLWLVLAFVALVGVAWVWRQITRVRAGLVLPVLSHFAADASIIVAIYRLSTP